MVRVGHARDIAGAWVAEHAASDPTFRGAFFAGSAVTLPRSDTLPASSDVDVVVVVAGTETPAKLGKFVHQGVLIEVTYLPWSALADTAQVARTYQLAHSFSGEAIVRDPTGHLRRLQRAVAASFADPAAVRTRYENAIDKLEAGLDSLDPAAAWHQQVMAFIFPASLPTHVVLVAALANPTVRLRYPAARGVLHDCHQDALYPALLAVLGCESADRRSVQEHLDGLSVIFDQAASLARTPFPFSTDISNIARPVAIDGSQVLIDRGDHREAVFWIIATYARVAQILAVDAPAGIRADGEAAFRAAVTALLGVSNTADLRRGGAAVRRLLPELRRSAAAIAGQACERRLQE